jgi:hypothetical protein
MRAAECAAECATFGRVALAPKRTSETSPISARPQAKSALVAETADQNEADPV